MNASLVSKNNRRVCPTQWLYNNVIMLFCNNIVIENHYGEFA